MRAVAQYDLRGNFIKIYNSIASAAYSNNVNTSNIVNCCKLNQPTSGGYQWRYYEVDNFTPSILPVKLITQYTRNGTYINSFLSIAEAARMTKTDQSSISRCCRGELKTAGGYVWKREKERNDF